MRNTSFREFVKCCGKSSGHDSTALFNFIYLLFAHEKLPDFMVSNFPWHGGTN